MRAAKLVNREAKMRADCSDEDQRELKRLKALLDLRNAELKAIRADAKVSRAIVRLDAARQRMTRVQEGEGFELAA